VISLYLPRADENLYILLNNAICGPFSLTNPLASERISWRHRRDSLDEWRGIHHENNVVHIEYNADLTYQPLAFETSPAPIVGYPDRIKWTAYQPSRYRTRILYPTSGILANNRVTIVDDGAMIYHNAFIMENPYNIEIFTVRARKDEAHLRAWDVTRTTYVIKSVTESLVVAERRSWLFTSLDPTWNLGDWRTKVSFATIIGSVAGGTQTGGLPETQTFDVYRCNTPMSLSIEEVKGRVDMLHMIEMAGTYPLLPKHNGDLAMEASAKVNANSVNMIAFLADLRDPKALIPKLKELKKLKGVADNYLTVNYGILPTIDDLKSITEAFKRRKPFFDRNGWKVYNADHRDSGSRDNVFYDLEQHIKLAIDDEDNGFEALYQRMDSIGIFPTMENIWDLIPYSFVIDWIIDVGGFLERVDARMRLQTLNIRYATWSLKRTSRKDILPTVVLPLVGTIETVSYHRRTSDQCPLPPLSLQGTLADFDRWIEASALIIQRKK